MKIKDKIAAAFYRTMKILGWVLAITLPPSLLSVLWAIEEEVSFFSALFSVVLLILAFAAFVAIIMFLTDVYEYGRDVVTKNKDKEEEE